MIKNLLIKLLNFENKIKKTNKLNRVLAQITN